MSEFQIKKIIRQADIFRKQGKFSQALILYNKAISSLSVDSCNILKKEEQQKIFLNKISCLITTFLYEEAMNQCEKLSKINPKNFKIYYQKANICFLQKNYQQAIFEYSSAISLCEQSQYSSSLLALYKFNRGLTYEKMMKKNLCILDYQDAIKLDQSNEDYYVALASIYQNNGNINQAYCALQSFLRINNKSYKVYKQYSKLLKSQAKYEQALNFIQKSIQFLHLQKRPDKSQLKNGLLTDKIYLLKLMSKNEQVLKSYDELISLNPQNFHYINNKAVFLDLIDRQEQAIKLYENIIQKNPRYIQAHINKGNTLIRMKKYNLALIEFNEAIHKKQSLNEKTPSLYYCHHALAYFKLHNLQQSINDLTKAYRIYACQQSESLSNDSYYLICQNQNQKFVYKILSNFDKMIKKIQTLEINVNTISSKEYTQRDSYNINQNTRELQKNKVKRFKKQFVQSLIDSIYTKKQFQFTKCENQYQILKDQIQLLNKKNHKLETAIINLHKTKSEFSLLKGNMDQQNDKIQLLSERVNQIQKQQEEIMERLNCQFRKTENKYKKLKERINKLKKQENKQSVVKYVQEVFWLLNAYFVTFRILKTELVKKDKPAWKSKIANALSISKNVISIFKQAPVIGIGFQFIQKFSQLYLQGESKYINQILYEFTVSNFFGQDDINQFISCGIDCLIQNLYIEKRIQLHLNHSNTNGLSSQINVNSKEFMLNKAKRWFQQKKNKIIQKLSGISKNQNDFVSHIVMEDIAKLFCYIIKTKQSPQTKTQKSDNQVIKIQTQSTTNIFYNTFIHKQNILDQNLLSLYRKSTQNKQTNTIDEGSRCKVCVIY